MCTFSHSNEEIPSNPTLLPSNCYLPQKSCFHFVAIISVLHHQVILLMKNDKYNKIVSSKNKKMFPFLFSSISFLFFNIKANAFFTRFFRFSFACCTANIFPNRKRKWKTEKNKEENCW